MTINDTAYNAPLRPRMPPAAVPLNELLEIPEILPDN